jgi:hypothetical protein
MDCSKPEVLKQLDGSKRITLRIKEGSNEERIRHL